LVLGVFPRYEDAQTAIIIYLRLAVSCPESWLHTAQCFLANRGIAINRWHELKYHLPELSDLISNKIYEVQPYQSLTLSYVPRAIIQELNYSTFVNLYTLSQEYSLI
jgi:hypothetical protein